ncbi:hypothetical protein RvY_02267 [Ramazzottius varieornatus]|uniref:Uncharacterized protein n=1 Tax=Ramazzottius varieornatus TaxID=947166 RepID=A0A1D1UJ72_RAMVA|nr:hypothetical protein RvY_02267 [Ramazzottius varieornatus]
MMSARSEGGAMSPSKTGNDESGSQVSINPKLQKWIDQIARDAQDSVRNVPGDLHSRCVECQVETSRCIPLTLVTRVAEYASQRAEPGKTPKTKKAYQDDFLTGAKWFFAEGAAPQKRDRDLETTVERIRNDAAEREYQRLTKNVGPIAKGGQLGSFATDLKVANKEAMGAFNCLLTVIGSFVFAYFATGLAVGNNVAAQVLIAVIVSAIVAIADVYFLLKKIHNSEQGSSSLPRNVLPEKFDLSKKAKRE